MSTLSTSLYGSTTSKGYTGLSSGLDVDEIVNQMAASTRNKINRQYQAKQKMLYKQTAYREINSKLLSFSNKYMSYSSGSTTNILSPSFFKSNTIKSSSDYVSVSGDADNIKNFVINSVTSVATSASFASSKTVSNHTFSSSELTEYTSSIAGETMTLEYGGKSYNLTIDKDFGKFGDGDSLEEVADQLNKQLATITGNESNSLLKYKVDTTDQKIVFENGTAKLTAGSTKILDVLNLKTGEVAESTDIVSKSLTTSKEEILSNKDAYMTFDLNGVTKTIYLKSDITDAETLKTHLQTELNNAFGSGKIEVDVPDGTNKLTFKTTGTTDLFGVSSISSELSKYTGISPSTYNRVNKTTALSKAGISGLTPAETYKININGEQFTFDDTMSVTDIVNKINSNTNAGVKISFSSTTDTFTVKSTETGSHKGVLITDVSGSGNLAAALFGTGVNNLLQADEYIKYENDMENIYKIIGGNETLIGTAIYNGAEKEYTFNYNEAYDGVGIDKTVKVDYKINKGTDTEMSYTLNGVTTDVTRSTTNFAIDGVNISLNEKAVGSITSENPATFNVTSNSDEVVEKVKKFIEEYNEIITLISSKTSEKPARDYQPLTPEQKEEMSEDEIKNWEVEAKKGMLYGDRKLNTVLYGLRNVMASKTSVSSLSLSDIGISAASYDTSGKLSLNESTFKTKLAQNSEEIAALFTGTSSTQGSVSGIALQIQSIMKDNVGTAGTTGILIDEAGMDSSLTSDRNYLSERMKEYDKKLADLKEDLEDERERYYKKFTSLEKALSNLNTQSSWLTDMMGS